MQRAPWIENQGPRERNDKGDCGRHMALFVQHAVQASRVAMRGATPRGAERRARMPSAGRMSRVHPPKTVAAPTASAVDAWEVILYPAEPGASRLARHLAPPQPPIPQSQRPPGRRQLRRANDGRAAAARYREERQWRQGVPP